MNKKAFTLTELITTVVILGLIAVLVFPVVINIIEENKEKLYNQQIKHIETIAYEWISTHSSTLGYDGVEYILTFGELRNDGFLKDKDIKNPKNGELITGCIKVKWNLSNNQYDYAYTNACTITNDTTPPTVDIAVMGNPFNASGWAKSNFNLKITVTDNESGAKSYKWCSTTGVSCTPTIQSSLPSGIVNMTQESIGSRICAVGLDIVNNVSEVVCSDLYKLDKTKPTIEGLSDITVNIEGTINLTAGVTTSDNLSGVSGTYTYDPTTISASAPGTHTVTYSVSDNAGNSTSQTRTVRVTAGEPSLSYATVGSPLNLSGWAKTDFQVTITGIDNNSVEIKNIKYCTTTSSTCTPSTIANNNLVTVTISTESTSNKICAIVTDNANIESGVICSNTYKLDKTAPTFEGLTTITVNQNESVNLTNDVTVNDNLSGVSGSYSNGSINTNIAGTKTVDYTATDNAGNTITQNRTIIVKSKYTELVLNGADPVLENGMIPIYFDGNNPKKADVGVEWYKYENKKWANAIFVTSSSRATYQSAAAGTTINEADILAYLVWIPRYKYKLFNTAGTSGTTTTSIDISFEDKTTGKSAGTNDGSYLTAPAFTFGATELAGFWAGKFETSAPTTSSCYLNEANCNVSNITPYIKPNVNSWRNIQVANMSTASLNMKNVGNIYGISETDTDTRMMKTSEWTAVSYLSHSSYGINSEVRLNNNNAYITGCGAASANLAGISTCSIIYGSASDYIYPQSTTGNITGIFDMAGGAWEYTMGVLVDGSGQPRSGLDASNNSGYNGSLQSGTKSNGVAFPNSRYYDLYDVSGTTCNGIKCLGRGFVETVGWYGDSAVFLATNGPWALRGEHANNTSNTGLFAFHGFYGQARNSESFRISISK